MIVYKNSNKWVQKMGFILLIGTAMVLSMCQGKSEEEEIVFPISGTSKEMITGTGGFDYGKMISNSMHTQFGINCTNNCHMASTMEWPNEDGAENFLLISAKGEENVEVCNKCHPPMVGMGLHSFNSSRFNRAPIKDFDGDGAIKGVQDEIRGLLDVLLQAIRASGVQTIDQDPFWENVSTKSQKMAIFNWSFVKHDKSMGVHNTARSVQLLQSSYKDLTGQDVPGADLYSHVPPPKTEPSPIVIEPVLKIEGVKTKKGKQIKGTALPNAGMGTHVLLKGFSLDTSKDNPVKDVKWSLTPPEGSKATLIKVDNEHVYYLADKMAWYEVTLSITDSKGNTEKGSLRIHSAFYAGVGGVAGNVAIGPQCASCHPGMAKSLSETDHAKAFARAIDGGDDPVKSDFREPQMAQYTLGYNTEANNNGFDEVAVKAGWKFPKPENQRPGNWDTMPVDVKQFGSVQCESCHGPGGRWIAASITLSAGNCGYCHDTDMRNNKYEQWSNSMHAHATSYAFAFDEDREACMSCHSAEAFIDKTAGKNGSLRRFAGGRAGHQNVTCAVCHDPHSAVYDSDLRVHGAITLYDGSEVPKAGASAVCMMCHNGRFGPDQVDEDNPYYPHLSTAAEMIAGTGGYGYGEELDDSPHQSIGLNCVQCHMAPGPEKGNPGHYEIGGHTLMMRSQTGLENIQACNKCHSDLTHFNRNLQRDYDGDGNAGGIQDEVRGLLALLLSAIRESGVEVLDQYPYWKNVTTKTQKAAIFNWSFVSHDKSMGIHNTSRSVQLLQRSFNDLTGKNIRDADLR